MFTIITNYKRFFLGIIKKEFAPDAPWTVSDWNYLESNGTNMDDLVAKILSDEKIDWADKDYLNKLTEQLKNDKQDIYKETKESVRNVMKGVLEDVLENGYTVEDEASLESLKRMMEISGMDIPVDNLVWKAITKDKDSDTIFVYGTFWYVNQAVAKIVKNEEWVYEYVRYNHWTSTFNTIMNDNTFESYQRAAAVHVSANEDKANIDKQMDAKRAQEIIDAQELEKALNNLSLIEDNIKEFLSLNSKKLDKYNISFTSLTTNPELDKNNKIQVEAETTRLGQALDSITRKLDLAITSEESRLESEGQIESKEQIAWNRAEFTEEWIKLIQEKLGFTWDDIDWKFWPKTLEKVKEISSDWKVWLWVLKKLWLVDENNNAIWGLTKSAFKPWQLEKGNSSKIIFNEKEVKTQRVKKWPEVKETSTYEEIKRWFKEVFSSEEEVTSFIGINGEKIDIVFNDGVDTLSLDTPYFDWINDYDLKNIPSNINSVEEAKKYLKENIINTFKEEYDKKVLDRAIQWVTEVSETSSSYVVWNFKHKWEQLTVKLSNDIDSSSVITWGEPKINGYYVEVDTLVWDWISDSDTKVKIEWELNNDNISKAVEKAKNKYINKFNEIKKEDNKGYLDLGINDSQAESLRKNGLDPDDITKISEWKYELDIDGTDNGYLIIDWNKITDEKWYLEIDMNPSIKTQNIVEVVRLMKVIYNETRTEYNVEEWESKMNNKWVLIQKYLELSKPIKSIEDLAIVEDPAKMQAFINEKETDKKDWKKSKEEFDAVDIWETSFDKEIEARWLEDLGLSEDDMKILKKAEWVHIDLSDIEKQDDWSYLIDIDGSMNLVVKKTDNWYHFTSDSWDFIFTDETVDNIKDAIISWTEQLNNYKKSHQKETSYDPTYVTRER